MIGRRLARSGLVVAAILVATCLLPGVASGHSLASSSVTIEVSDDAMTGTVALAVASLDEAFDADHRSTDHTDDEYADQVVAYLDDHLTVTGPDGTTWPETYSNLVRQTTEGIETITVDVAVDLGDEDPTDFAITYDAIIDAVPDHEAVLVLVDATNRASTPGVFTADDRSISIGDDGSMSVAVVDMARYGFHHVLDGADHLLFLLTLLLPAPLIVAGGRWRRGPGVGSSLCKVVHVVTAFTVGHSLTLVATSLGWITVPSRPVEVLIAVSVGVSALHAIRPLVRGGEPVIAATFGLIHGMAFAGILGELGLAGRTSLLALLAFNVGIELAQLAATALVFPSLLVLSRTRWYDRVRVTGAGLALLASGAWALDRLGLVANPLAGVESTLIAHPLWVVGGLATLAAVATAAEAAAPRPAEVAALALARW